MCFLTNNQFSLMHKQFTSIVLALVVGVAAGAQEHVLG